MKYLVLILIGVLLNFLKIRQGNSEYLLDYLSRFNSESYIVNCLFRYILIDGYV